MLIIGYSRAPAAPRVSLDVRKFIAFSDRSFNNMASLTLPAGIAAGSTLVAVFRLGFSRIPGAPAGWTLVGSDTADTGFYVYRKMAVGNEGGTVVNWMLNGSDSSAFVFAEIAGAVGEVEATFAAASNVPPSHAPSAGNRDYVWIAVTSQRRNDNAVSAGPAGYSTPVVTAESSTSNSTNGTQVTIGGAYRTAAAASENRGAFAWVGTLHTGAQACTVSVR
jgi:hypothetical protein